MERRAPGPDTARGTRRGPRVAAGVRPGEPPADPDERAGRVLHASDTSRRPPPPAAPPRRRRLRSCSTVAISAPSTSARICRQRGLAVPPRTPGPGRAPPSRSRSSGRGRRAARRPRPPARPASGAAGRVPSDSPTNAPRASGSGWGLRSPVRYGRNSSPSRPGRCGAGRLDQRREVLARRERVAEPAQAARRRQHHRHQVPAPGHGMAERVDLTGRVAERSIGGGEHDPGRAERQRDDAQARPHRRRPRSRPDRRRRR